MNQSAAYYIGELCVTIPLLTLFSWATFSYLGTFAHRGVRVLLACAIVGVVFEALFFFHKTGSRDDLILLPISAAAAVVIGLLFWGRKKGRGS